MVTLIIGRRNYRKPATKVSFFIVLAVLSGVTTGCPGHSLWDDVKIDPNDLISRGCCTDSHPGFAIVHDEWDPSSCGKPTSITANICGWQRYTDIAVGASMTVCVGQTVPSGWTKQSDRLTVDCLTDPNLLPNAFVMLRNS
jgi:hypothetical protein